MKLRSQFYWLLLVFPLLFGMWYLLSKKENKPLRQLSYYGQKKSGKDTSYHKIPYFEFTNQWNELTSTKDVEGKVYVTEYFFTTCQSICPIMNKNLDKIYKQFSKREDFLILSHTVDPETDSVSVLKNYSNMHQVLDKKWLFLTGEKSKLYELARKGYLLNTEEGNGDSDDFIHTQNFALIDKEGHIRGFYDGTDSIEIIRLSNEIELLFQAYEHKKNHPH